MTEVDGNSIRAIGYDAKKQQLHLKFNGGTYVFDEVPIAIYETMLAAKSKAAFFHANVKGIYPHRKISEEIETRQ